LGTVVSADVNAVVGATKEGMTLILPMFTRPSGRRILFGRVELAGGSHHCWFHGLGPWAPAGFLGFLLEFGDGSPQDGGECCRPAPGTFKGAWLLGILEPPGATVMMSVRGLPLAMCLLLACLSPRTQAGTIIQPVGVTSSMGESPGSVALIHLIDQSGLSVGYTSGVTDFDGYIAGNPTHEIANDTYWISSASATTGNLDFDLGGLRIIQAMALWNYGDGSTLNIIGFDLLGDADGDFSSGATTLLSTQSANPNTGPTAAVLPEVFTFAPTLVRYVRLAVTSNNGNPFFTGAGEVAFEQVAVSEPSSLIVLGTAVLGLFARRLGRRLSRTLAA
jgi:hypothetical protein